MCYPSSMPIQDPVRIPAGKPNMCFPCLGFKTIFGLPFLKSSCTVLAPIETMFGVDYLRKPFIRHKIFDGMDGHGGGNVRNGMIHGTNKNVVLGMLLNKLNHRFSVGM